MPREFSRSDRVASQIQKEMAELIRQGVRDTRLGMVTVSEVKLSRDLAVASIYVTFMAGNETSARSVKILSEEYAASLRQELGQRIRIRNLPELRFIHDHSIEEGMRMDTLINRLNDTGDISPEAQVGHQD